MRKSLVVNFYNTKVIFIVQVLLRNVLYTRLAVYFITNCRSISSTSNQFDTSSSAKAALTKPGEYATTVISLLLCAGDTRGGAMKR